MCDCHSYNKDTGKTKEVILINPFEDNKTVCIDACIVNVIKELWKNNIVTLGCCCGHNLKCPDVIISESYDMEERRKIKNIIRAVDDREWEVLQWQLRFV